MHNESIESTVEYNIESANESNVDRNVKSSVTLIENQKGLSEEQIMQFRQVVVEGVKGKFLKVFKSDFDKISKIVNLTLDLKLLPQDETFCIVENETGKVVTILLLNNFKDPSLLTLLKYALKLISIAGIRKAVKVISAFMTMDNYNKKIEDKNYVAEIYLLATAEDARCKGYGTVMMNHVLEYIRLKYNPDSSIRYPGKSKLLAFEKSSAIRIYERLGFKRAERVVFGNLIEIMGDEYDALIRMERPI